jgi:hypothetical protein
MKMIVRGNKMNGGESLLRLDGHFPNLDATVEDNETINLRGDLVSFANQAKPQTLRNLSTGVASTVIATAITKLTGLST